MSARADGGFVDAAVEAVGTDDRFLSGLEGALEVSSFGPDGAAVPGPPRRVPLVESAPGRYQARFPAAAGGERPAAGALLLRATLGRGARPVALSTGRLALPFAPELFPIAPAVAPPAPASPTASSAAATTARSTAPAAALAGEALLQAASARTGGRALAAPEDLFRGAQPRRTPEPLQTPLFVIAALLFVADVALRRLAASRGTRPAAAPAPRPPRR
jgi:hypothetical protein